MWGPRDSDMETSEHRDEGYYWVQWHPAEWVIAEWLSDGWDIADAGPYPDERFKKIGPKIEPPRE